MGEEEETMTESDTAGLQGPDEQAVPKIIGQIRELRFVFYPESTRVHVLIRVISGNPMGVDGWHSKSFPKGMTAVDIMTGTVTDNPIFWPQSEHVPSAESLVF
jgi:hypothetical protein